VQDNDITATLTVDDVAKAKNYCKKLVNSKWGSPSCVVNSAKQTQLQSPCDIPFCGKMSNSI